MTRFPMSTTLADTASAPSLPTTPDVSAEKETPPPVPLEVAPEAHIATADTPEWTDLAARFRPVFARIAEGAVEREKKRELAHDAVAWLREAGFGAVRIPRFYGGLGATLPQLFRLLLELAEADSNVSHLFRGHFAFLEGRLNQPEPESHRRWFPEVVRGVIFGYAMAERADLAGNAKLLRENGELFVDGFKYYSTGTIYADWIIVSLADEEQGGASVAVPVTAPGVTRIDDWDGFGQRLTGSGTTRFERVKVTEDQVLRLGDRRRNEAAATPSSGAEGTAPPSPAPSGPPRGHRSYQKSFLQLILLVSMAGAGRAALRESITFVRPRTRTFNNRNPEHLPKDDPLVQRVVGKVSSLVYSAETHVLALAQHLEELYQLAQRGKATEADFVETEIKAFQAQQVVIPTVLQAATEIFDVGGASATSEQRRLDRHWRNVRTAASHNPHIQRERAIGEYLINGVSPDQAARAVAERRRAREAAAEIAAKNEAQAPAATAEATASVA